ncbi:MAG: hypothetical protein IKX00_03170 [Bacilli bacterium]|nr:hypothetical protein [Bacilli bacterium]
MEITFEYLEYLRVNAIEAARLNILDEFINSLRNLDILKDFINYLGRRFKEEDVFLLNKINDLVNEPNTKTDLATTRA